MPNVIMSQDTERLETPKSKLSRGSSERKWTAVCQLVCGILALGCGIALIPLKQPRLPRNYFIGTIETLENSAVGIWGGLVFVATAVTYSVERKTKSMVGVYLGLCVLSAMIALLGLVLSVTTVVYIIEEKYFGYGCESYNKGCCFDKDRSGCYGHTNHYNYHSTPPYDPLSDYDSPECQERRHVVEERESDCWNQAWMLFGPHQIILGILIAVMSVELFASAYGACASVVSLCDCKVSGKRHRGVVYVPCAFGQPMNANNYNDGMMLPVSAQSQEQGMITAQLLANPTVPMSQTAVPFQAGSYVPPASAGTSPTTQSNTTPHPE